MVLKLLEHGADVRYTHKVRNSNFFDFKGTRSTSNHAYICFMCDAQHIGWTALHGAAYNGHLSVAIHLYL